MNRLTFFKRALGIVAAAAVPPSLLGKAAEAAPVEEVAVQVPVLESVSYTPFIGGWWTTGSSVAATSTAGNVIIYNGTQKLWEQMVSTNITGTTIDFSHMKTPYTHIVHPSNFQGTIQTVFHDKDGRIHFKHEELGGSSEILS